MSPKKKPFIVRTWKFLGLVVKKWQIDNCFLLSAALSYYTIFSIPAMLVIIINLASYFFTKQTVTNEINDLLVSNIGPNGAEAINNMIKKANVGGSGIFTKIISFGMLLFSSTLSFNTVQVSLNRIWLVKPKPERSITASVLSRVFSFAAVVMLSLLIVTLLIANATLVLLQNFLLKYIGEPTLVMIEMAQLGISVGLIFMLFALVLKYLPGAVIPWRYAWRGALITTILFMLGRSLIGLYLSSSNVLSTYGAASSVILLILWINYTAWIFFFGAEATYLMYRQSGKPIKLGPHVTHAAQINDLPQSLRPLQSLRRRR